MSPEKKKVMIRRGHPELSISQQSRLMKRSRSAFYRAPAGMNAATLALKDAVTRFGPPAIINADQGSRFTGSDWITTLTEAGVCMSPSQACKDALPGQGMDGRGRYIGDIFIERLWRSLKQEAVHLEEIADNVQARRAIRYWMAFYNAERPRSSLQPRTPNEAHWRGRDQELAARNLNPIHLESAAELSAEARALHIASARAASSIVCGRVIAKEWTISRSTSAISGASIAGNPAALEKPCSSVPDIGLPLMLRTDVREHRPQIDR